MTAVPSALADLLERVSVPAPVGDSSTLREFGNFAKGDLSEFADSSGANYGPSSGRTTVGKRADGHYYAQLTADNQSHLYGDQANNRIHLIGFAGGNPSWWGQGKWAYGALSITVPAVQYANTRFVYAGFEIHGANGTGPAPDNTSFQRAGFLWWLARGGVETNGHFDSQWEFGPQRSAPDGQHHHQDWAGGNKPLLLGERVDLRWDKLLDPAQGAFRLQARWPGLTAWREVVPTKTGIPTCYPNGSTPFLSLYQQTVAPGPNDPDYPHPGLQVVQFEAGAVASTAAERDQWQDDRLGYDSPPPVENAALEQAYATLKTGTLWTNPSQGDPKHPCKGYADANPGEAAQIDAYVAARVDGQDPTPPSLATATGRGIVGMLASL